MSFPTVDNVYTEGEGGCIGMTFIDPYLYVQSFGGYPSWQPKIHKVDPVTYEKLGEWAAPAGSCLSHSMCTDCEFLYIGTSSCPTPYRPIHVYKVDPKTMTTVASWTSPTYRGQQWAESIEFDFKSKRLLVLEDGYGGGSYRIYKLTQDLTEEMRKDAESPGPPYEYHGNDLTILGDHFYVATGGTPGEIVKRRISDLSLVGYFEGSIDDPDEYIEGIFFSICNDGEYVYAATYDYHPEDRPARLIKVDPSDMSRVATYYGDIDEVLAMGCYAYSGKIYMLLYGWNGVYWDDPGYKEGEQVLQIDPTTMTKTSRYQNWTGVMSISYEAVGDGSRLHVGFWWNAARNVLQFAEPGTELCALFCTCTSWINAECTAPSKRRQIRTCTPAGCDIEERIIDDPTCVPSEGTLSITTSPTGASIMVDGVTKTSPCSFSLAQEIYTVTISKAGYDTIMDNVNIIAGATTTKSYTLTLSKKMITIESVPAGATVKLV